MKTPPTAEAVKSIKSQANVTPLHETQHQLFPFDFELLPPAGFDPSNPRHVRIGMALLGLRGLWRYEVDDIAGCANGPQLMADIGHKNIHWICTRIARVDRDGRTCKPGYYELTPAGRELITCRLDKRKVA